MINQLKQWSGPCEIDGQYFDSFPVDFKGFSDTVNIKLYPCAQKPEKSTGFDIKAQNSKVYEHDYSKELEKIWDRKATYKITVKSYMTRKSNDDFRFMAEWNDDNPMPLLTMTGVVTDETKGMVYMKLHGQAQEEIHCLRCGRELKNPVSRLYGIGPECITKIPVFFNIDINDVDSIKEKMVNVEWEGWIIKSSILTKEKLKWDM